MEEQELRARAITQQCKRRELPGHVLAYVLVNALLVVIWATSAGGGFFWPIFPILGWGIGIFFRA